jgi:hypothetical protein
MAAFEYIEFQRTRDFSNKMNATIEFVKQNIKSLGRCTLYFIGPPALLVGLLMGSFVGNTQALVREITEGGFTGVGMTNLILKIGLALVGMTITSVITTATVNGYIIIYRTKQSNQIEPEEVWLYIKQTFFMYFGVMLGVMVVFALAFVVMMLPVILLVEISGVLGAFAVIGLVVFAIYLIFANSLVIIVRGFENASFLSCFKRSMFLTRSKWWSTFGLMIVFTFIVSILGSLVTIPWTVTNTMRQLHQLTDGAELDTSTDWFGIISNTLGYLFQYLLGILPQIALIFQYFNLVEMKESRGLIQKMETMGDVNAQQESPKEDY